MNPFKNLSTNVAFVAAGMLVCCGGVAALRVAVHEEPSRWEWLPQSVATSARAVQLSPEDRESIRLHLDQLSGALGDLTSLAAATKARREAALADPAVRTPGALPDAPEVRDALSVVRDAAALDRLPSPIRLGRVVRWSRATIDGWLAAGAPPRDRWEQMRGDQHRAR